MPIPPFSLPPLPIPPSCILKRIWVTQHLARKYSPERISPLLSGHAMLYCTLPLLPPSLLSPLSSHPLILWSSSSLDHSSPNAPPAL
eukprot:2807013-Rhodomonas_salina.1